MLLRGVVLCVCFAIVYCSEGFNEEPFEEESETGHVAGHAERPSKLNGFQDSSLTNVLVRTRRARRTRAKYDYNLKKIRIREAGDRNAICLDGSEAVFYLSRNHDSKNWVVQLQAGGSCDNFQSCQERVKGPYGSSQSYDQYMKGVFVVSDDPRENPTFASWNKVYVPYCSGDVFVGRKRKYNHPYGMHMLGHFIVKAVFQQLMEDFKINNSDTKILFGGASAGGLGMLANIDFIQELVHPAKMKGFNDGGWFTLYPNFDEKLTQGSPYFFDQVLAKSMFNRLWNGFVDESCRAQMPKAAGCLYGELVFRYLSAPIFVMVAQWDSYQLLELVPSRFKIVSLPPQRPSEARYLVKFANNTHRSLGGISASTKSGVFSPACVMHTFSGQNASYTAKTLQYHIRGKTAYKALSEWYVSNGKSGTYLEQPREIPSCNPSCCNAQCSTCRKPSLFVANDDPTNYGDSSGGAGPKTRCVFCSETIILVVMTTVTALVQAVAL